MSSLISLILNYCITDIVLKKSEIITKNINIITKKNY